ncbi:MAG TPA: tetratricopeptide repeat protein [Microthrixaceae bacterium]|nr:tetratricopeptide repeat protein [Microthrixaceae bacterium]
MPRPEPERSAGPSEPPLPSGEVTFVLTDIEGSTSLFRRLGDAYPPLLEQHHRLLRRSFSEHGGAELGTEGDSFLVAFDDIAAAVSACVALQRALLEQLSGPPAPIRVRVGVHTGPATPTGREYVSLVIHQAARISTAAHGGQVLLSQASAAAFAARPVSGAHLVDLGLYQLRDFPEPQSVFQLSASGMPGAFPPPRALSVLTHNLPFLTTRFVGREEDDAALRAGLERGRLVTLAGPGGVGKTRLSIEVGHDLVSVFPGGVWLVDLTSVSDPRHVPLAVARALDVTLHAGTDTTSALVDALRPRRALLVLDNCEHVIEGAAVLVEVLLHGCPELRVVATSREPLDLDGEIVQRVRPLPVTSGPAPGGQVAGAAVQLFVDRAAQAGVDVSGEEVTGTVVQIASRLDGLPLAIELAAAMLRHLSIAELLDGLAARFDLLSGGRRGAPPRHRTLDALVRWSVDLLSEPERRLFSELSVFRGGWTTLAAASVCGGHHGAGAAVASTLTSLADKSLIVHEAGSSRFTMMETIRGFAAIDLAARDDGPLVRGRYLDWCVSVAESDGPRLGGPDRRQAMRELADEEGNLRDAFGIAVADADVERGLRLAVGLEPYWLAQGPWDDGAEQLDALLGLLGDSNLRPRALVAAGNLHLFHGHYDLAEHRFRQAGADATASGDHTTVARALSGSAYVRFRTARLEEAEALWSDALSACPAHGADGVRAAILRSLAIAAGSRGDQGEAARRLEEAMALARRARDDQLLRLLLTSSAEINATLGRYETAFDQYEESLRLATDIADHTGRAMLYADLAWLEYLYGDRLRAEDRATEALELASQLHHHRAEVSALRVLGEMGVASEDPSPARTALERAISVARTHGGPSEIGGALCSLACLHVDLLELDHAATAAVEALAVRPLPHVMRRASPRWVLGEVARLRGDLAEAHQQFTAELEMARAGQAPRQAAQADRGLAELARAEGDLVEAVRLHHGALRRRAEIGHRAGVVDSLEGLALVAIDADALDRAALLLSSAAAFRARLGLPLTPREAAGLVSAEAAVPASTASGVPGPEDIEWNEQRTIELGLEDPRSPLRD